MSVTPARPIPESPRPAPGTSVRGSNPAPVVKLSPLTLKEIDPSWSASRSPGIWDRSMSWSQGPAPGVPRQVRARVSGTDPGGPGRGPRASSPQGGSRGPPFSDSDHLGLGCQLAWAARCAASRGLRGRSGDSGEVLARRYVSQTPKTRKFLGTRALRRCLLFIGGSG